MPKVKSKPPASGRKKAAPVEIVEPAESNLSSVLLGLAIVLGLLITLTALLGGSIFKLEQRWSNTVDSVSRHLGVSVQTVEVRGLGDNADLSRRVRDAAMIVSGENMFRADPYRIRQRVEATQLVTNVRVYRLWPDAVVIHADAAMPSALWFDGESWQVVDRFGEIMPDRPPRLYSDLIRIAGAGAPDALRYLKEQLLEDPDLAARIDVGYRISNQRWNLKLTDGKILKLPHDRDLATGLEKLRRQDVRDLLGRSNLASIDLRLIDRVVVSPEQETS